MVDTAGTAPARAVRPCLRGTAGCCSCWPPWRRCCAALEHLARGKRVIAGPAAERAEYVHRLRDLACARHFLPVIDRTYPFDEIRAAHEHMSTAGTRQAAWWWRSSPAYGRPKPQPASMGPGGEGPHLRPFRYPNAKTQREGQFIVESRSSSALPTVPL
ncbi:MAG: zinc-binding dehydrogenase [Piscinibacter sp.]|nr:zinc-binding dehydrogenase [Piscinibacter sp.]